MSKLEELFLELREANTKYSIRVLELEKENTRLDEENHKLAYSLSQSVPVESSIEQYDRIKELEEIINSKELLRQHMNSIGYRELCKLKQELQATREQLDYLMNPYSSPEEVMRRRFEVYDYLIAKDKQKDEEK